nr:rhomboid-like protein [Streptomyces canus]
MRGPGRGSLRSPCESGQGWRRSQTVGGWDAKGGVGRKEQLTLERTAPPPAASDAPAPEPPAPEAPVSDACFPDVAGLLDGMPRQRERGETDAAGTPWTRTATAAPDTRVRFPRLLRLLPTPTGTPFTFVYGAVLAVISLVAAQLDPAVVHTLHQGSSTDVAHLVRTPVLVLVASASWIAGGILSPYALALLFVLTALERRIGGVRTAGVFLFGHIGATLATEVPIGLAVVAGQLPASSLHRLDYGVSFGVAASLGALAGLLGPWLRWPLLALFGWVLVSDLIAFTDPLTDWGHPIALTIGVATWPLVRRRYRDRQPVAAG